MGKVGKVFKAFFKVIFTICAIVAGVLNFIFLGLDFISYTNGSEGLSTTFSVSGYALAFGGKMTNTTVIGENSTVTELGNVNLSVGTLIGFILLCLALILSVIYLVCAWGKKSVGIKKFFAFGSALCFLTAGIIFLCALPLGKASLGDLNKVKEVVDLFKIGSGAVCSGVFSICAALFALIAGALGPNR